MMNTETLYLKLDRNIRIASGQVRIGELAFVLCSSKETEKRVSNLKFPEEPVSGPGRFVYSVTDVMQTIWNTCPNLTIDNLGETDFILTLEQQNTHGAWYSWMKTAFVCLLSFFGAAFSIMAFNNDIDVTRLFGQLYETFTGSPSDGFTLLEGSYSFGVGLGILIFFHHFSRNKKVTDPTPLEVEMRTYEDEVNTTMIEGQGRQNMHQHDKTKRVSRNQNGN